MAAVRRIGRLRHRVELQQQIVGLDSLGRQNRTGAEWQRVALLWAAVIEVSGREAERARQIVADASHAVAIRYRAGVNTEQRLLFRSRVLEIRAVLDEDGTQRELLLLCGEQR